MSVQASVFCLDCREQAPGVGDGGFMGAPVLAVETECDTGYRLRGIIPSFSYIYQALAGIGLLHYEIERFREFLVAHPAHRCWILTDHDDPAADPEELRGYDHDTRTFIARLKVFESEERARQASGEFVMAVYQLRCDRCDAVHHLEEAELLRAMAPMQIDPGAAALAAGRFGPSFEDWTHRLMRSLDPYEPFFAGLPAFLHAHGDHGLEARQLIGEAE